MTLLVWTDHLPVWAFLLYILLASVLAGLYGTNSRLVVPSLVPQELLGRANAVSSLTQRVASMGGPAVGGVMVAVAGPASALAFNALTFCVSACIVYMAVPRMETQHAATPRSLAVDAYRGILELRRQPAVMRMVLDGALIDLCLTDLGVAVGGLMLMMTRLTIRDLSSIP